MVQLQKVVQEAIGNLYEFCIDHIDTELWPSGPTGIDYLDGLVRDSPDGEHRGSYISGLSSIKVTLQFLLGLNWSDITSDIPDKCKRPGCQYLGAIVIYATGKVGVISLRKARRLNYKVTIDTDGHGEHLSIKAESSRRITDYTNEVVMIIEDGMMSTWYPGPVFPDTPKQIPENPLEWDEDWPVKVS